MEDIVYRRKLFASVPLLSINFSSFVFSFAEKKLVQLESYNAEWQIGFVE